MKRLDTVGCKLVMILRPEIKVPTSNLTNFVKIRSRLVSNNAVCRKHGNPPLLPKLFKPAAEKQLLVDLVRIPVKWAGDSGDVGQSRSEATLVVFLH
jgi:hypothetical protein